MRARATVAALVVTGAVGLSLVPIFGDAQARWAAGMVAALGAFIAVPGVFVVRATRRTHASLARLERLVVENHKRASVWNFHLMNGLGLSLPQRVGNENARPEDRTAAKRAGSGSAAAASDARRLLDSGILDVEYYSALVGFEPNDGREAAEHYIAVGASRGVSPTPFLDLTTLPAEVASAARSGEIKRLLEHLRSPEAYERPLSALFDPRVCDVDLNLARRHPGGVLGAYLTSIGPDSVLAVPADNVNAGTRALTVRSALIDHAREVHSSKRLAGSRTSGTWDFDAEAEWLNDVRTAGVGPLPLVSVVMAVRDRADVVGQAIRSVQDQTHERWELIVVDDGSQDDTRDRVRAFAASDSRIRIIEGFGKGSAHARNVGLGAVTGQYVAFLDSDNQWVDHYLEVMLSAMQRDGLAAGYSAIALHSASGTEFRAYDGGLDDLLALSHIDLNVFVVRADVVRATRGFDESLRRWIDHDFAIKIARMTVPRLLPFIGCWYDGSGESDDRISVRESEHWQWVVLGKHHVHWPDSPERVPGRVSVVVPTFKDHSMTKVSVDSVLRDADAAGVDIEVIVVDNGSGIDVGQELIAHFGCGGRVKYTRLPRNLNFAIGCNSGASRASGEFVLFLNNDTVVRSGALSKLLNTIREPAVIGVQPLLVYGDERVQSAGTVFTARDALPNHLLVGHPPADALTLNDADFHAVSAAALLMRTGEFIELGGFDPIFVNGMEDVDLCLRGRDRFSGQFRVVPEAIVTHLEGQTPGRGANVIENRRIFLQRWRGRLPEPQRELIREAGFLLAHVGTDGLEVPGPRPVLVRDPADARIRWGIVIASDPGRAGDTWGDTHFAESLRAALVSRGQSAVVHRGTDHAPAAAYDDVVVVIRGKKSVIPIPGKVNILWVISHPEQVDAHELREFDLVFAASPRWASEMSAASGVNVEVLLQATDLARFTNQGPVESHPGLLFVGGTHEGRDRRTVSTALAAGIDLRVYGRGWAGKLPAGTLRGDYIPNDRLSAHYRGADRVLADHWEDMARHGFVQNRVFDAVASGARVVSDPVEGIEELFYGAVRTFRTPQELALLCADGAEFPDDLAMADIAGRVRREHSFHARADRLIAAVTQLPAIRDKAIELEHLQTVLKGTE